MYNFVELKSQMKQIFFLSLCLSFAIGFPYNPSYQIEKLPFSNINEPDSLKFTLFPNPVKNKILFIESSSEALKEIEIYYVLGEVKFTSNTYENRILLDELKTGIYIFVLQQEGKKGLKRLVIP